MHRKLLLDVKRTKKRLLNRCSISQPIKIVFAEATDTLQNPTTQPNPWQTGQKKKKKNRRPQIDLESAESEIEGPPDTSAPSSAAHANAEPILR